MSKQTKHRYLNSFFITTILYLVASFFLFFVFADTLVIEEKKPEEVKISIKQMMTQQESIPVQPIVEPTPIEPPAPEKKTETIVEKKIEKPKKEKHHEKKHIKEPIVQEIIETKPESTPIQPIQKVPVEQTVVKQVDTVQIENIEAEYLSKIRNIIEKNNNRVSKSNKRELEIKRKHSTHRGLKYENLITSSLLIYSNSFIPNIEI